MATKHTDKNWYDRQVGAGLLPAYWQCWKGCEFEVFRPRGKWEADYYETVHDIRRGELIARSNGPLIPKVVTAENLSGLMESLLELAPDGDDDSASSSFTRKARMHDVQIASDNPTTLDEAREAFEVVGLSERRMAESVLTAMGPLYPNLGHAGAIDMYSSGTFLIARPPLVVSVARLTQDLRRLRQGLLLVDAIQRDESEALARLVRTIPANSGPRGPAFRSMSIHDVTEAARQSDGSRVTGPDAHIELPDVVGDVGAALYWLRLMATMRPLRFGTSSASHQLLPRASAPGEILWLSLAHAVGAITLPYGRGNTPLVSFCAECGKPVYSLRPRNRGVHVFCDPPDGKDRSVCANRYFSRLSKQRIREARLANGKEAP